MNPKLSAEYNKEMIHIPVKDRPTPFQWFFAKKGFPTKLTKAAGPVAKTVVTMEKRPELIIVGGR